MNFAFLTTTDIFGNYSFIIMIGVMFAAMYFLMIRPQKKKEKEAKDLRSSIEIGDEITTIGGIVGRVVSLKEDSFVIETAGERSRLRMKRWAIQDVGKLNMDPEGDIATTSTAAPSEEKKGFFSGLFGGNKDDSQK